MSYRGGEVDELERGVGVSIAAWRWRTIADELVLLADRFSASAESAEEQGRAAQKVGQRERYANRTGRADAMRDVVALLNDQVNDLRTKANELEDMAARDA